nr:RNA-directed DNA polymerase, eukaryota, reverse transcriptase zinc-binding domain protein [Tanacetum cinerariifolium]
DFGYEKVDAIGSAGGIVLIWDNTYFVETKAMGDEGYLAVVRIVLKCAKITKNRTISTQDQKPQRKAGSGSKFSANNHNEAQFVQSPNLGTILAQRSKPKPSKVKCQSPGTKCVNFSKLQEGLKVPSCQSSRLKWERKLSDHCSLVLMDKNIDFGPKPFHCFDAWMEEKECEDIVKYCWEKSLKNEATKWEVIAESRDLEEVELDRWKEARKGWVEKDKPEGLNVTLKDAVRTGLYKGGIRVHNEEVEGLANRIRCLAGKIPFTYLGIPIGVNMKKVDSWKVIMEKFKKSLGNWKTKMISCGGRLTLIKLRVKIKNLMDEHKVVVDVKKHGSEPTMESVSVLDKRPFSRDDRCAIVV